MADRSAKPGDHHATREKESGSTHVDPVLDPERVLHEETILICLGRTEDLERLQNES